MRHAFRSHAAESLIETLVAITVIVVSTTAALTVMRTALSGNDLIERKVIAVNLALEGIEALRNLRDTNYLLYASDPDNCWNKYGVSDVADCSDGTASEITEGTNYFLVRNFANDPLLGWSMQTVTGELSGKISLYDVDIDGDGVADTQMFAQRGVTNTDFTVSEQGLYRRRFTVVYATDGSAYDATVTVTWTDYHGLSHSIDLTRTIRNIY